MKQFLPAPERYIRLPRELSKRCKLSEKDIEQMKRLRHDKEWSYGQIGKRYSVSPNTVRYNTDPLFRFTMNRRNSKNGSAKWKNDEEYRKRHRASSVLSKRRQRKFPPQSRYALLLAKKRRAKARELGATNPRPYTGVVPKEESSDLLH